eukprot:Nk52_evm24s1129 gene=Nk52_evmTU24s1129
MVRIFSNEHEYPHSWEDVTSAFWRKYPNPHSKHVVGADFIQFSVDEETKVVKTRRLLAKTNSIKLPAWGRHFVPTHTAYIVEDAEIDPINKKMTTFTRNITYSGILKVEERVVYTPIEGKPDSTCCAVQATVKSGVRFWSHPLEMFGIERFKKSAVDAQNALKYAISEYRDRFLKKQPSVSS